MIDSLSYLRKQWRFAHEELGLVADMDEFKRILDAYCGNGRHYHGIAHLAHGLRVIDSFEVIKVAVAILAFFYHDMVYERHVEGQPSNEQLSAMQMRAYCSRIGMPRTTIARIERLIMATMDHQNATVADPLWAVINDADLAIFSAPADSYDRYAENVWKEYEYVGRAAFVAGRSAFLANFKTKPIFRTSEMKPFEPIAKANIEREIAALAAEQAQ